MNGVININKPAGWTSQDVCAKLRNLLHIKKIGHTGTLDPMATGVLPVCIGKATRIIEYYDADIKTYIASMQLGITTDTLDMTGDVLETSDYSHVTEDAVREAFKTYTGRISQIPPKYSALRINGRRAYDLAREGKDFEIKSREIMIYENRILSLDIISGEIVFEVSCSKGTYIRTICDDIGKTLGCGAAMKSLERTASGYFMIKDAVSMEELYDMNADEISEFIIPADITLENLGIIELNDNRINAFCNGNTSGAASYSVEEKTKYENYYRVYAEKRFLGIAGIEGSELIPKKVLAE